MNESKFKNRPNYHLRYNYNDGRGIKIDQDFWISRSVAVVGVVFANTTDGLKVLIAKRSLRMLDEGGKWGVPCGYLDWNETTHEAMMREVYEETSLYLPDIEKCLIFDNNKQTIRISDDPNTKRQNISLIYVSVYDFIDKINKFPLHVENFSNKETTMVSWLKLTEFFEVCEQYQWAFNHDDTIKEALKYFNKNFSKQWK